ncbi:MAG: oligoendopeptidase F [Planctomycetota bacterium]|jgi:oligoendopeptidase F
MIETATKASADWDLTPYFSGFQAPDYAAFREVLEADYAALAADNASVDAEFLLRIEDAMSRSRHLSSYLGCMSAADSRDEAVSRERAGMASVHAEGEKLMVRIRASFKAMPDTEFDALLADERLVPIRYALQRLRLQSQDTMTAELEELSADLGVTGISAWSRLYDNVSGKLEFSLDVPGQDSRQVSVAMTRSLLNSPDPAVRRATAVGSSAAWESVSDSISACLNSISGTRLQLYKRRGIDDFLKPALFQAGIERNTLDTMLGVVRERQGGIQEFLKRKAQRLGMDVLAFHDTGAPLAGGGDESIEWPQATERVFEAFGRSYPELADFAREAVDKRWIDYAPRDGKRPGAFCSSSYTIKESRVFMTYNGTGRDLQTLAHELGHAWHNCVMRDMRPWARGYPMTLAETASTFAERLMSDAQLERGDLTGEARLGLLDQRLSDASAMLLNIPMRFDFEKDLYERRAGGELSVSELCQMMIDAQIKNYGDALDPNQLDPWFWASKLHFYIGGLSFYNFPYTFGYLFSMGIFARAKAEGPSFLPVYEELLRRTASDPAELVAREVLGVDLGKPDFWNASIDLVDSDLKAYLS